MQFNGDIKYQEFIIYERDHLPINIDCSPQDHKTNSILSLTSTLTKARPFHTANKLTNEKWTCIVRQVRGQFEEIDANQEGCLPSYANSARVERPLYVDIFTLNGLRQQTLTFLDHILVETLLLI